MKTTQFILTLASATAAVIALTVPAQADTLYNILTGQNREVGNNLHISPADDVRGVADIVTANQYWLGISDNSLASQTTYSLVTSTGASSSLTYTTSLGSGDWGSQGGTGSRIWESYNYRPSDGSFAGLDPAKTYDLYVLANSFWGDRAGSQIHQTAGTGMSDFWINENGVASNSALTFIQDSNSANVIQVANYALFTSLAPTAGGVLGFSYIAHGGRDGANSVAGYQLVEHTAVPEPCTAVSLLGGLGMLLGLRRRRE